MQHWIYAGEVPWKTTVINRGHISIDITKKELDSLNFREKLPCYRQTSCIEKYYNEHNSSIWQILDDSPQWVYDLAQKIPQDFKHFVVSVIKDDPGQVIPYHVDLHTVLRKKYGENDSWRYLIFLEDWKQGHYFEIDNEPIVKWRAGDWVKFHRSDWHLGGNMGSEPFYSVQVTVI